MRILLPFISLLFTPIVIALDDLEFHGFIDSYHAARINKPHDFLSSWTRLRLEGTWNGNHATGFASSDLEHNSLINDYDELDLREIYVDYFGHDWDLRVGKQIIIWGETEGLQILDAVSPWDYREFLARDFDDLRKGVEAIRWRWLQDNWNLELVVMPDFEPASFASADSPWAFPSALTSHENDLVEPENTLKNAEYGARLNYYLSWGDLSFVALRSWTDEPVTIYTAQSTSLPAPLLEYQRQTIYGMGLSIPRGNFIFRGELAVYSGNRFQWISKSRIEKSENAQLKWVAGLQWNIDSGLTAAVQVTDSQVLDYHPGIPIPKHNRMMTVSLEKNLFRETLKLSSFSFIGLEEGDTFTRTSLDYALSDATHLLLGIDIFTGDEGYLAAFSENDQLWLKFKYNF